jgi:predicted small secreted protein
MRKTILSAIAVLLAAHCLAGCNTFEGLGKDIKKGGEAIEQAADKARK